MDPQAVIKFLTPEGCKLVDIHQRMVAVYGDTCVTKPMVTRSARMFSKGRQETTDLLQPGQSHKVMTVKLITNIGMAIKAS
ncbi:hypothetical protein X975_10579, partial [Stegodyphus mimosarum]